MANDLFAPPTQDEMKLAAPAKDLFAPPSKDEMAMKPNAPDGSRDNPTPTDLYGGMPDRLKSSFGDDAGVGKMLLAKGFVDFARNKNGDLVAKNANGEWQKDQQGLTHPINWLAGHTGAALPLAGGIGGGIAGAYAAGAGAIPGAVAGGALGEGARIGVGKMLDNYAGGAGDVAKDMATEGVLMGAGEGAGRYVMAPLMKNVAVPAAKALSEFASPVTDAIGGVVKSGISHGAELLSGHKIPAESALRSLERPYEVEAASQPRAALNIAKNANQELMERNTTEVDPGDIGELSKLANPSTMESFANSFNGPNKTMVQDAAQRVIPNSIEPLNDLAAAKGLNAKGYVPMAVRTGVRMAGKAAENFTPSNLLEMIGNNPRLMQSVAPQLRGPLQSLMQKTASEPDGETSHYEPGKTPEPLGVAQKKMTDGSGG